MKTGKIYKLTNTVDSKYYIGSSVQKYLSNRLSSHKTQAKKGNRPNCKLFKHMLLIGCDKWKIKLIEVINFELKKDLYKKENEYIDLDDPDCLNVKKGSGIYKSDYDTNKEYEKARYLNQIEYERKKSKLRWQKIKQSRIINE